MKRILIVHTHGGIGGAGQSLLDILVCINNLGLDITVYCPSNPPDMIDAIQSLGVKVLPAESPFPGLPHYSGASLTPINLPYWKSFLKICLFGNKYVDELGCDNYDYIIVNSMIYSWISRFVEGNKLICFHRETYLGSMKSIRNVVIQKDLSRFRKVIFISCYDAQKTDHVNPEKKLIIKDSVFVNKFAISRTNALDVLHLPYDNQYILFVGGNNWIKGGNIIVKALKYITDEKIKLIYMPWSNNRTTLKGRINPCSSLNIQKLILRAKLMDRVLFFNSTTDMAPYYSACSIAVFPSVVAHQARPIYEAGAAKKTIIITDFEETEENLIDGYNGRVFSKGDYKELARVITELLNNQNEKEKLEMNNYQMTISQHNMKKFKEDICKFFVELENCDEKNINDFQA